MSAGAAGSSRASIVDALTSSYEPGRGPNRPPRFPPLVDATIARFIEAEGDRLAVLVARHGSPLNIVWPHTVARNVDAFTRVLDAHEIDYEIFYGAKVNKSKALVRAAVDAGVGIDVSSLAEFEDALRAGSDPARICVTGPAKTAAFHQVLVAAGALIAVDSLEELADLEAGLGEGRRARILLRLRPTSEGNSRFGMSHDSLVEALHHVASDSARVSFEGFHAHLGSYAVLGRIAAMAELAVLVDIAAGLDLAPRMIDIGGGMPIRYVAPDLYEEAFRAQRPEHYRKGKVPAAFYPYGSVQNASDWIAQFLAAPFRGDTIAGYLRAKNLQLGLEPGRSLVDQAAISIFRVTRVKPLGDGASVVFVEGSGFSACETWCASEFLIDPILVPLSVPRHESVPLRAYIAGHSCLDDDVVTNRFLDFPSTPCAGDLLIYANTAGYQMDLLENEFHRHPMPTRLVACLSASGESAFVHDK